MTGFALACTGVRLLMFFSTDERAELASRIEGAAEGQRPVKAGRWLRAGPEKRLAKEAEDWVRWRRREDRPPMKVGGLAARYSRRMQDSLSCENVVMRRQRLRSLAFSFGANYRLETGFDDAHK